MNWKLILLLSIFGLIMGFATVSLIPFMMEPVCWLAIFIICAYIIAKNAPGRYFLHGFIISLINCIWIVGAHVLNYQTYLTNHPNESSLAGSMHMAAHPRLAMVLADPFFGIVFGLILGLFAWIAGKIVKKPVATAS